MNLRKKIKTLNAFSLAEILVVLGIASFIIIAMMTIIKPGDKELKHQYYKAYHVLATATYNLYQDSLGNSSGTAKVSTGTQLCQDLLFYMNTTTPKSKQCKGANVSIKGDAFPEENIQFTASNGMIFYFSPDIDDEDLGKQRIVWVDINGTRGPNTAVWSKNKAADIVAFSVVDYGEVIPLGYPKIDSRYMLARVYVPSDDVLETYDERDNLTDLYTFYNAQQLAYGGKVFKYDSFSYLDNPAFKGGALEIKQSDIPEKLNMLEDCKDPENPEDTEFSRCSIEIED